MTKFKVRMQRRLETGGLQELVGELVLYSSYNIDIDSTETEELIFDLEKAVNAHSNVRLHILEIDDEAKG